MYVRYLLVYRLWKKVNNSAAVRSKISASAISSLGTEQPQIPAFLRDNVLPAVPKSSQDSCSSATTKFLVSAKFDIEKSCGQFLRFTRSSTGAASPSKTNDLHSAKSNHIEVILGGDSDFSKEKKKKKL